MNSATTDGCNCVTHYPSLHLLAIKTRTAVFSDTSDYTVMFVTSSARSLFLSDRISQAGLDDEELEVELEQALKKWDSKFKSKAKIASANSVKSVIKSVTEREEKTKEKAVKSVVEDEDDEDSPLEWGSNPAYQRT